MYRVSTFNTTKINKKKNWIVFLLLLIVNNCNDTWILGTYFKYFILRSVLYCLDAWICAHSMVSDLPKVGPWRAARSCIIRVSEAARTWTSLLTDFHSPSESRNTTRNTSTKIRWAFDVFHLINTNYLNLFICLNGGVNGLGNRAVTYAGQFEVICANNYHHARLHFFI